MFELKYVSGVHKFLWALFFASTAASFFTYLYGAQTFGLLRFDTLSCLMLTMVTLLGAVIGQYSLRYLSGDQRQKYFFKYLLVCISAVSVLVLSNQLLLFFSMWIATSVGLHRLLLFYQERPAALLAAKKKFLISRIGDLCLIVALALTYKTFNTLDFEELFQMVDGLNPDSPAAAALSWIGLLFIIGAMTKSAQFPFHGWLPDTMETPTPVSALMHAGIINAGGFLIIRLSPILQHAKMGHIFLMVVGSLTAVLGVLTMITQNNIKKKLAYSTISQMGVMMFSCGLGAYSIALFHIIAHSFYKAYAFLSTGMLLDESKKEGYKIVPSSIGMLLAGSLIGLLILLSGIFIKQGEHFAYFAYASVLALGFWQSLSERSPRVGISFTVYGRIFSVLVLASGIFLAVEVWLSQALGRQAPFFVIPVEVNDPQVIAAILSYGLFCVGFWLSSLLMVPESRWSKKLYMYLWNGGYFSYRTSRLFKTITPTH